MTPDDARRGISQRDLGLRRLASANRWLVAGAVALSAFFTAVAALAHPGSTKRGATSAATPTTSAPAPAPAPTPESAPVPQPSAPEPSQLQPPASVPQPDPTASAPPVASSGGS